MARRPPQHVRDYFAQFQLENGQPKLGTDWLGRMVGAMADVSTLAVMSQLLKQRKMRHTASDWQSVKEKRLQPAIAASDIKRDDVRAMLRDMEEHGRMHVLLYRPKEDFDHQPLFHEGRVANALAEMKLQRALDSTESPDAPVRPAIVNVRFESDALIIKSLETKTIHRPIDEFVLAGSREIRLTQRVEVRRMRLARLHANGLLEIRLGAVKTGRRGGRHSYVAEAEEFLQALGPLIPGTWFEPASLGDFKVNLWTRAARDQEPRILVLGQTMATDEGGYMTLSAKDRVSSAARVQALRDASAAFLRREGSSVDQATFLWPDQTPGHLPDADVMIGVTRHLNEFYTTRAGSRTNYERVFSDIRRLGDL